MKYITPLFVLLLTCTSLYSQEIFLRGGMDISGTHMIGPSGDKISDDVSGKFVSAEFVFSVMKSLSIGGGLSGGPMMNAKEWEGDFGVTPVYALVRYKLSDTENYPYFGVRYGLSNFKTNSTYNGDGSTKSGAYLGFMGGFCYKIFNVEFGYHKHSAEWSLEGETVDIEYTHLSISGGLRLKLQ